MKGIKIGLLLGCLTVAACVPKRQPPPPPPVATPQPAPPPRPAPPPPPVAADWRDRPLTPGAWIYRAAGDTTQALFGPASSEAQFVLRCDRARRQVSLWRAGQGAGGPLIVRTTGQSRSLPAAAQAGAPAYLSAVLPANDRFLDEMLFSRGRIMVETAGLAPLIIPTWPEPARVVEDCRG